MASLKHLQTLAWPMAPKQRHMQVGTIPGGNHHAFKTVAHAVGGREHLEALCMATTM